MVQERLIPPPSPRSRDNSDGLVAQIGPTLHAARQSLSPAQRGALNRGIVRHESRGASVDEIKAFINAFAADPVQYAKDYPAPPPLLPNRFAKPAAKRRAPRAGGFRSRY